MKGFVSGLVLTVFLFFGAVWATPLRKPAKIPKTAQKALFPSRLDGFSNNPGFRFVPLQNLDPKGALTLDEKNLDYLSSLSPNLLEPQGSLLTSEIHRAAHKKALSKALSLETSSINQEQSGLPKLSDALEYGKILKQNSVGVAYWLTPNFILNGRYAAIKQQGSDPQLFPSVGATYMLNTRTSVSLSYRQPDLKPTPTTTDPDASAELKIHF